jgi:hypothetical protein
MCTTHRQSSEHPKSQIGEHIAIELNQFEFSPNFGKPHSVFELENPLPQNDNFNLMKQSSGTHTAPPVPSRDRDLFSFAKRNESFSSDGKDAEKRAI